VPIGVSGSMIEPQWLENGAHFDVANLNYGSTASNMQVNYFSNGENVPPYYVGFNEIENCSDTMPWTAATCSNQDFSALGVAEHLDDSNWSVPIDQGGSAVSGSWGGTAAGGSDASTFTQMACHQRYFATISAFLVNNPDLPTLYRNNGLMPVTLTHNTTGTLPDGTTGPVSSFTAFNGFDSTTNSAIQTIYSWDREINGGYPNPGTYPGPGAAPMYPWSGC
jgi:hypothetical protein